MAKLLKFAGFEVHLSELSDDTSQEYICNFNGHNYIFVHWQEVHLYESKTSCRTEGTTATPYLLWCFVLIFFSASHKKWTPPVSRQLHVQCAWYPLMGGVTVYNSMHLKEVLKCSSYHIKPYYNGNNYAAFCSLKGI